MERKRTFTPIITKIEVTNVRNLKPGGRAFGSTVLKIGEENGRGSTWVYLCDSKPTDRCLECVKTECPLS